MIVDAFLDALFTASPGLVLIAIGYIAQWLDGRKQWRSYEQERRRYTEWRMNNLRRFYK